MRTSTGSPVGPASLLAAAALAGLVACTPGAPSPFEAALLPADNVGAAPELTGEAPAPWAEAMRAFLEQDARRVFIHPGTGARVVNRPGFRAIFLDAALYLAAPEVGVEMLPEVERGDLTSVRCRRLDEGADHATDLAPLWAFSLRWTALASDAGEWPLEVATVSNEEMAVSITHRIVGENAPTVAERYESRTDAFEETLEILAAPAADFTLRGTLTGTLHPTLVDGALVLSGDGEAVLQASPPRAWDGVGRPLETLYALEADTLAVRVRGATTFPVRIDPVWESTGDNTDSSGFGYAVDSAGDVNGDGFDDVVIGAYTFDTAMVNAGRAYLYFGSPTGPSMFPDWYSSGDDGATAYFGRSVAGIGDVDGDGYDEIAVGAPGQTVAVDMEGRTFVYPGTSAGTSATASWASSGDLTTISNFGRAVAGTDVNGDGYDDLIVGAYSHSGCGPACGLVVAFVGGPTGLEASASWSESGTNTGDWFGYAVASAGDVDGDGYDEVLVGAPLANDSGLGGTGQAYLFHGSASGLLSAPSWVSTGGDQPDAWFGRTVNGAGDVNGDGYDDLVVAGPYYDAIDANAGRVLLYTGSAAGADTSPAWSSSGQDQADAAFGIAAAGAGDVNGDGLADVVVGANSFDVVGMNEGRAYLFPGAVGGLAPTWSWFSSGDEQELALFGLTAAGAGDINNDGYDDVIVGAPLFADVVPVGKVYLYLGAAAASGLCDPGGVPCDDGDACTSDDACDPAGFCTGMPVDCDDGDPCTADSCDALTGCEHVDVCGTDAGAGSDGGTPGSDAGDGDGGGDCRCHLGARPGSDIPSVWIFAAALIGLLLRQRKR